MPDDPTPRILCTSAGLLGSWWCVPLDATAEEIAEVISTSSGEAAYSVEQVPSRLFGGFRCQDGGRRHVYHAGGHYTFLSPGANTPMDAGARSCLYVELIAAQREDSGFVGGGPCCEDAPAQGASDAR